MRRLALALLLFLLPALAAADELVYRGETTLWHDTVWQGEVLVDGILTVAPGVTLEIRPGTVVRFTPYDSNGDGIGEHEIFISGSLHASGTAVAPIRFTSSSVDPRPGSWGTINLMASDEGNRLEHLRVEYAYRGFHAHFAAATLTDCEVRRSVRGVQFQESRVTLERCRLVDNGNGLQFRDSEVRLVDLDVSGSYWGVRGVHSRVAWEGGRVDGNLVNGVNLRDCDGTLRRLVVTGNRKGIYLQQSRVTVSDSQMSRNSEHGIFLEQGEVMVERNTITANGRAGIKAVAATGTLRGNRIDGNGEYALVNDAAAAVDARGNWWGTNDPLCIAAMIRDRADLPDVGPVAIDGFLSAAP